MDSREESPLINQNKYMFLHTLSKENEVGVFIWYSGRNAGYGVGHIAIIRGKNIMLVFGHRKHLTRNKNSFHQKKDIGVIPDKKITRENL